MMIGDVVSGGAIIYAWLAVFSGVATPIVAMLASLVAIVFYGIQISERRFVRAWIERRRLARIANLTIAIAKLQAKSKVVETTREVLRADAPSPLPGRGDSPKP